MRSLIGKIEKESDLRGSTEGLCHSSGFQVPGEAEIGNSEDRDSNRMACGYGRGICGVQEQVLGRDRFKEGGLVAFEGW